MDVLKNLLQELAAIEFLESELEYSREIKDKQLEKFMAKPVNSVSYDEERVNGGISSSEEAQVMNFAKTQDEINKLEDIIRLMRKKVDSKFDAIANILTEKERRIFKYHFIDGRSFKDMAYNDIDLCESRIFRISKGIKAKIKELDDNVSNMLSLNEKS